MAVARLCKLRLLGLQSEQDLILNTLHKTRAVQIKICEEFSNTASNVDAEFITAVKQEGAVLESATDFLTSLSYENPKKAEKVIKDGFAVSFEEFDKVLSHKNEILTYANEVIALQNKTGDIKSDISAVNAEIKSYSAYLPVKEKFSTFKNTKTVKVFFGIIPSKSLDLLLESVKDIKTAVFNLLSNDGTNALICLLAHNSVADVIEETLSSLSFSACPFSGEFTAKEKISSLKVKLQELNLNLATTGEKALSYVKYARSFKLLSDRLSFEIEKADDNALFRKTQKTFILEAFIPVSYKDKILNALSTSTSNIHTEVLEVDDNDNPPTLMQNGNATKNFEFVTNMYSVPSYHALDPNSIMGFFFSLFMGIITADWGYGILLAIACFLFARKKQGGISRLAKVLGYGGLFAIPFGLLFDSFFGFQVIHKIVEVYLGANNVYASFYTAHLDAIKSFSSLGGISMPTLLLWSCFFGCIHLTVGYILKAVSAFKNKDYVSAFGDGLSWAVFVIGLASFAFSMLNSIDKTVVSPLKTVGLSLLGVGLLSAIVAAVKRGKGFSRLTGGFVSVYGIINLLSDILSYARLYGLMLSGAQIAAIFTNTIAIDMLFPSGAIGIIFGVIIIIVGNLFNLAMSVLGAFIHDSRLQYVEFFGKFYEGDGELFTPLGSSFNHIVLNGSF